YLKPGELALVPAGAAARVGFAVPDGGATFFFRLPEALEIVGPMKLRLHVELQGTTDAHLFVGVSKIEGGANGADHRERALPFEGAFGFGRDVVAHGWLRTAHRRVDPSRSEPHRPYLLGDRAEPLRAGEIAPVEIEILPSATSFARGDLLRLDVQGRWFWRRSMFFGMFPSAYAPSPSGTTVLHLGDVHDAHLLVPLVS
ncbi:MAG TPA: CocE/NonD family hydrolase C-terminal non-catalytic domain-containing protein, partial [Polyangia bacterium]|nr:CocE/NonD family hydrolase C-terminal non-catalytic domain-containing protein [Polyangia bacterium]